MSDAMRKETLKLRRIGYFVVAFQLAASLLVAARYGGDAVAGWALGLFVASLVWSTFNAMPKLSNGGSDSE